MMMAPLFTTVFGRNLMAEVPAFAHRPYLVVTMEDLWPRFSHFFDGGLAGQYFVRTLEMAALSEEIERLPRCNSVVGLGGGQAVDVAKLVAWSRRLPLFQFPTAMSVDAPFGHRAAVRIEGKVRYVGWAVPEAVYVDFDVIRSAPARLNRAGVGDVFCYHTAAFDWKLAHERGKTAPAWPFDPALVAEARGYFDDVMAKLDGIRDGTDEGIRALATAFRYGGGTYHNSGWTPCHVEGVDHFFFYALEYLTGKHFIHGQPVCLGIYIGSLLQENEPDRMLAAIQRAGVDIRPEAMGVTWGEVAETLRFLPHYVEEAGLWYTVASDRPITEDFIARVRADVTEAYADRAEEWMD